MADGGGIDIANEVARAIAVAMDWSSTPDARKAAVSYLESIKMGDIRSLTSTSFLLIKKERASEIRLHGYKMLQHLVRLRWDEFTSAEKINFANAATSLIFEVVDPLEEWAIKSQTTALVAEVVRREGLNIWQEFLPSLVYMSSKGPIEAEMAAMMLRWIPEDITVHNEDLEGDRRRALLRGLTQSLPEILPLLYNLLEKHFGSALENVEKKQFDTAKQHANTVTAVLNAINAYAEWVPVSDFVKYGLMQGCGFLLSSIEFRHHVCEFFKLLSQRRRPDDDSVSSFNSAMINILQILMNVSRSFLYRSISIATGIEESEHEFFECICEAMVALGSSNMQCILNEATVLPLYLEQMLGYFRHFKFSIHFQSLLFWLVIMRSVTSRGHSTLQSSGDGTAGSTSGSGSEQADNEKKALTAFINDDMCAAILDVSFRRMLKKTVPPEELLPAGTLELWSEDFDGKIEFSQYRSRLVELIRLVASYKPSIAVTRISEQIDSVIKNNLHNQISSPAVALLESLQLGLETVISATFDGPAMIISSNDKLGLYDILQGLLQQLFHLKWTEPTLAIMLGRYLDAFGPFLKCFPDSVGGVINKLFELLTSLPFVLTDSAANSARHARLQICSSFIRIARAADKSLLPHMKAIADTMGYLETEGRLLRGERNLLSEAFMVMASSSGFQKQQEVLAWLLAPLNKEWTQIEWQDAFLSSPLGLASLCSDTQFMWSIFHMVSFFEKALKRSGGTKKGSVNLQMSVHGSTPQNPMSSHLSWMLPPLLKLLRCLHSICSHQIAESLPIELRAAMSMGHSEQASLLGEVISKPTKGRSAYKDGSQIEMNGYGCTESVENDLRNWLRGIRDSGYNVLGMSATIGECFFQCLDSSFVAFALMENVQSMEFRHIRQLVRLAVIPIVRYCPPSLRENWLVKILVPLFTHCQHVLSCSWSALLNEGRAKVSDIFGTISGLDLKVEVMEEKLLRALTREVCQLLHIVASPTLNSGIPSLDQLGNVLRVEASSLKDLNAFVSDSLTCFFLIHKSIALPVLQIMIEAFSWTDGEAVNKVASFCGTVILLSISANNDELKQFVAKDLFYAILHSLTLESNAVISSELVELCREIFVYLSDRDPAPRQVLLTLPGIKTEDLLAFEDALAKTSSSKEQKQLLRSFLQLATGNTFKALASQKVTNVITNVSAKPRSVTPAPTPSIEDDTIGLAAIT